MYERFTDRARKIIKLANNEAQRLNHEIIGTEHILLGLTKLTSGVGSQVLKNLDVNRRRLRFEIERLVSIGPDMVTMRKLPQTPGAQKVLEYAIEEARSLNHNYVGSEHILLGLLQEKEGIAAQVLMDIGIKLEVVRKEVMNILNAGVEPDKDYGKQLNKWREGMDIGIVEQLAKESLDEQKSVLTEFKEFLVKKKGYSRACFKDIKLSMEKGGVPDLHILDPNTENVLALVEFMQKRMGNALPSIKERMSKYKTPMNLKRTLYYAIESIEDSTVGEHFTIYELEHLGDQEGLLVSDFPSFNMLRFIYSLENHSRSTVRMILLMAEYDLSLQVNVTSKDWINLKAKGRTVAQIHRYGESSMRVGIALAGYIENFPDLKSKNIKSGVISLGLISLLSGFQSSSQKEINWLNGKLGHEQLKYPAGVYVIDSGIFSGSREHEELVSLIKWAKENVKGPVIEPFRQAAVDIVSDEVRDKDGNLVDRLGIKDEINALSSLIALKDVAPPLSIGLFGDWGSGKSFFMEKMYERINLIQENSRRWIEKENESAFCTHIVQIRFNAWHYMDANLWASLVTHIFDELAMAVSIKDDEEDLIEKKKLLFQKVESAKELLKEAENAKESATQLKREARKQLNQLKLQKDEAARSLSELKVHNVVQLAKQDPRVQEQFREIADKLGLRLDDPTSKELRECIFQTRSVLGRTIHIIKTVKAQKKGRRKLVLYTMFLVGLPALLGIIIYKVIPAGWYEGISGVAVWLIGSLLTYARILKPKLALVSKGLEQWEKTQEQIQSIADEKSGEKNQLQERLRDLEDRENKAHEEVLNAEKRLDDAEAELKEIQTGQRLFRLIEEGSRRSEYKEKLGIIALIRKDFNHLSDLIYRSSKEKAEDAITRIDRIVLYIDDLDRCPSERVVEVLQAVHLILAFKLFVVVVGVDSRWILHALKEQYSAFGGNSEKLDQRWVTTPQNYVEKIFQIPFVLQRMENEGYKNLVSGLTKVEEEKAELKKAETLVDDKDKEVEGIDTVNSKETVIIKEKDETKIDTKEISGTTFEKSEHDDIVDESESDEKSKGVTIDMEPPALKLSEQERTFMKALGDLIPSPRATKRFVNIYKLICATLTDEKKLRKFKGKNGEGGDYQAVLLMLAILTGYPDEACDIIKVLEGNSEKIKKIKEISVFIQKLDTEIVKDTKPPIYKNIVREGITESDQVRWKKLCSILNEKLEECHIIDSLEPFVEWAGVVGRFCFQY